MFWISEWDGFFLPWWTSSYRYQVSQRWKRKLRGGGMDGMAGQGQGREEGASNDEGIEKEWNRRAHSARDT